MVPVLLAAVLVAGCVSLRTTGSGEANTLVVHGPLAYVSLGEAGFGVVDPEARKTIQVVPPPPGSGSADDLAGAEGLLFVLDAREPGFLSVFSLADPRTPALTSPPVAVPVGPFTGFPPRRDGWWFRAAPRALR